MGCPKRILLPRGSGQSRAERGTTSRAENRQGTPRRPLINAAGELGVAAAQQHAAVAGVDDAKHQAQAYLRQAQFEVDAMLAHARDHVTGADDAYRQAHHAALTAGWSPAALADMGYSPPAPPKRNRNQPPPHRPGQRAPTLVPAASDQTRVA